MPPGATERVDQTCRLRLLVAVAAICTVASGLAVVAARAGASTAPLHACVGAGGLIRVEASCHGGQRAVRIEIAPIAQAASRQPGTSVIRPHSITGREVKSGSLPGSDITRGTLPASALASKGIGQGLLLSGGVLSVNPLLLSPFQDRVSGTCPAGEAIRVIDANGSVVCQTAAASGVNALTAGTGIELSPNPIVGSGSIAADMSVLQSRVTGTPCALGAAITDIAQSGAASCQTFVPATAVISTPEFGLNAGTGPELAASGPFSIYASCDVASDGIISIEAYSAEANSVADVNTGTTMTFGGGAEGQPAAVLDETETAGHFFSLQFTLAAPSGARLSGIFTDGYEVLGSQCVASVAGLSAP
jgi:hypothetical protein